MHNPDMTSTQRILALKNKFLNHRLFLIGNGSSINLTPMEKLVTEYTFSFNRAFLAYGDWGFIPKFYSCIDLVVLPDNETKINNMIHDAAFCETLFFFPAWAKQYLSKSENVYFVDTFQSGVVFEENLSKLALLRNVGATSVQIAVHLGFSEIILIGCDANYIEKPDGVEIDSEKSKKAGYTVYRSKEDSDPNHFLPNYFGKGTTYSIPNLKGHLKGWQAVENWVSCYNRLNHRQIRISDASIGGKLPNFQKVDIHSVLLSTSDDLGDIEKNQAKLSKKEVEEIIVLGTGSSAKQLIADLPSGYSVKYFIDDGFELDNTFFGRSIYPLQKIYEVKASDTLVSTSNEISVKVLELDELDTVPRPIPFDTFLNSLTSHKLSDEQIND